MDKNFLGFGIAGNFTDHLEQAGESIDFVDIKVDTDDAPKGIFPTYIPNSETFLGVYPFSDHEINFIEGRNIHMEPEMALECEVVYENDKVKTIIPQYFAAYNDCSIRVEGAKKISHKKNWGKNSKGISLNRLPIDRFSIGGVLDDYSLVSYIKRDGKIIQYGEDSEILGYSYFYDKLINWVVDKLNNQKDEGPLEDLNSLILQANKPKKMILSIGATRYTAFGESNYLERGDTLYVVVYNHRRYDLKNIIQMIKENSESMCQVSFLKQRVV